MGEIQKSAMNTTVAEIFRRKEERRRAMARLPFEEKIKIVEELREFAKATAPHRAAHREKMKARRKTGT
ncbi:MAG TPA: hypothetical protein VG733_01755 [Chthoniobacteraceae bacterium]|nr:hypothetical protein [Chthoniobacteraceae bacterium]